MIAVVFVCIVIAGLLGVLLAVRGRTALELRVPRPLSGVWINVSALRGAHTSVAREASAGTSERGPGPSDSSPDAPPEDVERAVRERLYGSRRRPS